MGPPHLSPGTPAASYGVSLPLYLSPESARHAEPRISLWLLLSSHPSPASKLGMASCCPLGTVCGPHPSLPPLHRDHLNCLTRPAFPPAVPLPKMPFFLLLLMGCYATCETSLFPHLLFLPSWCSRCKRLSDVVVCIVLEPAVYTRFISINLIVAPTILHDPKHLAFSLNYKNNSCSCNIA